jgi:hypothetical protein
VKKYARIEILSAKAAMGSNEGRSYSGLLFMVKLTSRFEELARQTGLAKASSRFPGADYVSRDPVSTRPTLLRLELN